MGTLIDIHLDVLPRDYCLELYNDSLKKISSTDYIWKTNYSWSKNIVKSSHGVLIREIEPENKIKILTHLREKKIIDSDNFDEYYCMNYLWTRLSYIPWHNDHLYDEAISIYLNDFWDPDWGGYFMYEDNNEIKAITPKFNCLVKNTGNIPHSVSLVSQDSVYPRSTLQIFKPRE